MECKLSGSADVTFGKGLARLRSRERRARVPHARPVGRDAAMKESAMRKKLRANASSCEM